MTHCNEISTKEMNAMLTLPSLQRTLALTMRVFALLFIVLASCGSALAQGTTYATPKYDFSGAFSYTRAYGTNSQGYNLVGGSGEFTYHFRQWLAAAADAGAYNFRGGLPSGMTSTMYTVAGGPRFTFRNYRRLTPFAQLLVGGGRLTASSGGINAAENSVVMLAGVGVDVPLSQRVAIRAGQLDYMLTKFALTNGSAGTQHNLRLSIGLVIRFGQE